MCYLAYHRAFYLQLYVFLRKFADNSNKNIEKMYLSKYMLCAMLAACLITSCKRKTFDEYLASEAEKFTLTQCPREIDKYIRIDKMEYDSQTHTLHHYYTLKNELEQEKKLTESIIDDYRETMLVSIRDDISLKKHKENNVTFCYHYFLEDNKEKEAFQLKFTPKDYNGKLNLHTFNFREVRKLREFTQMNCPIRQDACTVLDSIWYDSISRTYCYDYSLEGELDNDSIYSSIVKRDFKKSLIKGLAKDQDIATERDKEKLNFAFRYFSSTTKKLLIEQVIKNEEIK